MAATLRSATSIFSRCCKHAANILSVSSKYRLLQSPLKAESRLLPPSCFHTSSSLLGLMEFFDDKKNWGEDSVKSGRPWRVEELRIKSNSDLHKLWYVLLKERNMLLTMQQEYTKQSELFPNPERIEKVEDSMENVMTVVKERDEAYNLLETGTTGEPGQYLVRNFLGLKYWRHRKEYHVPKFLNKTYNLLHPPFNKNFRKYLRLYYEKKRLRAEKNERKHRRWKKRVLEEFPHLEGKL